MTAHRTLDFALVAATGFVLLTPIVRRVVARTFDPFEPLVLFVTAYAVMFVVRPAAMILSDSVVYVGPRAELDVSGTFSEMLLLALLGAASFVGAYALFSRRQVGSGRHSRRPADGRRLVALAACLAAIAVASFVLVLASLDGVRTLGEIVRSGHSADLTSGIETYRYAWMLYLMLIPVAVTLLGLGVERRSRLLIGAFACVAALVLLRAIPLGERISLLPFVGAVFVLYYLVRSRRPSVWTLSAVALVALFSSAFLSDLRGREARGETALESVPRAASRLSSSIVDGPDSEMAPVLAAALSIIPEKLDYRYGRVIFGDLFTRPVPRPLWEGKPRPPRDELIATLWPIEYTKGSIQPEFSVLLYFYWDFGLLGVVLGLAALGIGARCLYHYHLANHSRLAAQVVYALSLWFVVIALRGSPVDTLVFAAFIVAPAWLIFRLAESERAWGSESPDHLRTASPPAT